MNFGRLDSVRQASHLGKFQECQCPGMNSRSFASVRRHRTWAELSRKMTSDSDRGELGDPWINVRRFDSLCRNGIWATLENDRIQG